MFNFFPKKREALKNRKVEYIRKNYNFYNIAPFPILIKSKEKVFFVNDIFVKKFTLNVEDDFTDFFNNFDLKVLNQIIKINNIFYNLYITKLDESIEIYSFMELSFNIDNEKIIFEKIVIAYIYVDNYDDVTENMEEIQKPIILGVIDRKLNEFTRKIDGVLTKFDRDRYVLFFNQEKLVYLKESKFEILNHIRETNTSTKIPFTLSIGIGCGKNSLTALAESARSATDLALGRGGDQAVIKNGENFFFYGGRGKEYNTGSRVKARVKAHIFGELIKKADNVIIMGHTYPDLDCISSGIGVCKIVKTVSPNIPCNIVVNQITSSISTLFNRVIQEEDYKNGVFIDSKKAIDITNANTLVVVVDSYRESILECPELINISKNIVVFDHHRKAENHIKDEVLVYHDVQASSTAELVTEMIMYMKSDFKLLDVEADALLSGITVDTKGFVFKTSSKTFEAAAYLKKQGADSSNVHVLLQSDFDIFKSVFEAVQEAEIYYENFAISYIKKYGDNPKLITAKVSDELLNIGNVKMSFAICPIEDSIMISARSLGEHNVQSIMEKYGGGGHKTVAAAQVSNMTLEELIQSIKNIIDNICEEEK